MNPQSLLDDYHTDLAARREQEMASARRWQANSIESIDRNQKKLSQHATFLATLVESGHEKLVAVLDPQFLEVQTQREAFAKAVEALSILHDEIILDIEHPQTIYDDRMRKDLTDDSHTRRIVATAGWANERKFYKTNKILRRDVSGMVRPRQDTSGKMVTVLHPTDEGKEIIEQFRESIGETTLQQHGEEYRARGAQIRMDFFKRVQDKKNSE